MCYERAEDLRREIVALENEMLERARDCGGCGRFPALRSSVAIMHFDELKTWSPQMLENYVHDLLSAKSENRNLLCERYAYQVKTTEPEKYAAAKTLLPEASIEKLWLVDLICAEQLNRKRAFAKGTESETPSDTDAGSMGIGLRSELMTYSVQTLRAYAAHLEKSQGGQGHMADHLLPDHLGRHIPVPYSRVERLTDRGGGPGDLRR